MRTAVRWSGPVLLLGGVLWGAGQVVHSFQAVGNPLEPIVAALLLSSAVLLLLSLPSMYAAQAEATGSLGLSAHVLLQTGVLTLVLASAPPLLYPGPTEPLPQGVALLVLGIALALGLPLTAIATRRGGVFPRGAGNVLLVAAAFFFFGFFIAEFLPHVVGQVSAWPFGISLAIGFGWIGVSLWNRG